jgi:hypothetical protein
MRADESNKVWHALNAKKSKYFLVNVVPQRKESDNKTIIF